MCSRNRWHCSGTFDPWKSELVRNHLFSLYNAIFVQTLIRHVLSTGIIVPILTKNKLNPNEANNYRPITLSPTHGKIVELLVLPLDGAHENQFGLRTGRGSACSFLNDLMQYCRFNGSPMFICIPDADVLMPFGTMVCFVSELMSYRNPTGYIFIVCIIVCSALFAGRDRIASHSVYVEKQSKVVSFLRLCLTYVLMTF